MSAPGRKGPRTLRRFFRLSLLLIPFGVAGNLVLSWAATDRSLLASLGEFPRGYLVLAVALGLIPWFTNALRIWIWTRFIGHPLPYRDAFRITLGGELGSSVLPTSTGGEVFRWGMMLQKGISPGAAASVVTLGHVEDTLFFLVALPLAAWLSSAWELPVLRSVAGELRENALLALGVGLAVLFVLRVLARMLLLGSLGERPRRWGLRSVAQMRRRFRKVWEDAKRVYALVIERGKAWFLLTTTLTAVQWICRYSVVTALAAFLGATVDPVLFFLLQWVVFTVMLFIPTPGAAGGAEAAFYLVYSALLPERMIGLMTAGWRLLTFYLQLALGALIFLLLNVAEARMRPGRGEGVERNPETS